MGYNILNGNYFKITIEASFESANWQNLADLLHIEYDRLSLRTFIGSSSPPTIDKYTRTHWDSIKDKFGFGECIILNANNAWDRFEFKFYDKDDGKRFIDVKADCKKKKLEIRSSLDNKQKLEETVEKIKGSFNNIKNCKTSNSGYKQFADYRKDFYDFVNALYNKIPMRLRPLILGCILLILFFGSLSKINIRHSSYKNDETRKPTMSGERNAYTEQGNIYQNNYYRETSKENVNKTQVEGLQDGGFEEDGKYWKLDYSPHRISEDSVVIGNRFFSISEYGQTGKSLYMNDDRMLAPETYLVASQYIYSLKPNGKYKISFYLYGNMGKDAFLKIVLGKWNTWNAEGRFFIIPGPQNFDDWTHKEIDVTNGDYAEATLFFITQPTCKIYIDEIKLSLIE